MNTITKEHILSAIEEIDEQGIRSGRHSSTYDLIYDGKPYPPKLVISIANRYATGEELDSSTFAGGLGTDAFKLLEKFDFKIVPKKNNLQELIEKYKKHIQKTYLEDEKYKWALLEQFKGRPNLDAEDFPEEIKGIKYNNLIYPMALAVLHIIIKVDTEAIRSFFKDLFNDSLDLSARVSAFTNATEKVYRNNGGQKQHHQDERSIATYLTFYNPEKYTFYKYSFYKKLCELLNEKEAKKNEKYQHYLVLLNSIIEDFIQEDAKLISLVKSYVPEYNGTNHLLLAQDILYQALDKNFGKNRTYWRIGTKDDTQSYWSLMKKEKKVCIGWYDLGDLDSATILSKNEIINLFDNEGIYKDNARVKSRKAGEIFDFYKNINIGDIVLAQDGETVLGIGEIKDDYYFNPEDNFPHQKNVEWRVFDPPFKNSQGNQTTVYKITDSKVIKSIDSLLENTVLNNTKSTIEMVMQDNKALNQILYGPPGTGKTYNTINKALEIINDEEVKKLDFDDRIAVKTLFDKRMEEGQIVFTTFHQSMSYEDFIEGIKPETLLGNVTYDVIPGIFLDICDLAQNNWENVKEGNKSKLSFEEAFSQLKEDWEEDIETKFPLKTKGKDFTIIGFTKKSIQFKKASGGTGHTLSIGTLKDYYYKKKEVRTTGVGIYYPSILERLNKYQPEVITEKKLKNYILIIDEINRGNVSQIFGELITLIEEDKRLGKDEALEVTLPYSKEKFGVPPNLYIIGTMNTADRSVEALDTALRRRFSFEEMPPRSTVVEEKAFGDYPRAAIMEKINNRIELLLDRNHTLGHAYFIKENFKNSFENEIIPLLQEYFYNDYGKIGLVLGKGFVRDNSITKLNGQSVFADFETKNEVDIVKSYELIPFAEVEFEAALQTLLA